MSALLFAVAALWGALALAVLPQARGFVILLQVLLYGFGPPILLVYIGIKISQATGARFRKLREAAGLSEGQGWEHREGQTWLALNPTARTMTVVNGPLVKTYPYADIRAWESQSQRAERFVGVGLQAGLAAAGANARAASAARAQSGFFVTVRDIDHPVWRIEMIAPVIQQRWMELFRQEINEGGARAASVTAPAIHSPTP